MLPFPLSALDRASSGSFVDETSDIPVFIDPMEHPIYKILSANFKARKNIYLFSPQVESILLIHNGRVMTCNVPHMGFDSETDKNFSKPLLVGALGSECSKTLPCIFRLNEVLSDCLLLGPEFAGSEKFPSGTTFPSNCFTDDAAPAPNTILRPKAGDLKIFQFPKCIPKLLGVPVIEGSLYSAEVLQSLADYHPLAETWGMMHKCLLHKASHRVDPIAIQTLHATGLPTKNFDIPIVFNN